MYIQLRFPEGKYYALGNSHASPTPGTTNPGTIDQPVYGKTGSGL
jgi:hypothetical protein